MHVVIVSHMALPHIGGLESVIDYEIRAFVASGHRVTLVTSDGTGPGRNPTYSGAVRVIRVPSWHILERALRLPYPLFSPLLVWHLWHVIGDCDIVHMHGFVFLSSLAASLLGVAGGKRCILTDHGGIQHFNSGIKRALIRLAAHTIGRITTRCASRLVTFNGRIARDMEYLSGTPGKCAFLPNPVDKTLFRHAAKGERDEIRMHLKWSLERKKILFVGRLIAEKGVGVLVRCVDEHYDLVFCGPGDPTLLGKLPTPGIEYLNPAPSVEVARLYRAADLLVVPSSRREGFPMVAQEALCCGLRVLLGYDEGFEPYRSVQGLSFCVPTVSSIKEGIQRALDGPLVDPVSVDAVFPELAEWQERLMGVLRIEPS